MRIEVATKYRCDGCGIEQHQPSGWQSLVPLVAGSTVVMFTGNHHGKDYCLQCLGAMTGALHDRLRAAEAS